MCVYVPKKNKKQAPIDTISYCVSVAETSGCTKGVARYNNCHGFMVGGKPKRFKTKEESYEYFKKLWVKRYSGGVPTIGDAIKYTGGDNAERWLSIVRNCIKKK